ncbi:BtrH N-terminal domain-containing protein [Conexibacter sp. DBS9H8]|uniref:BtrH N-terminal domain-containing protein n=1 Tax=Conexibacter sp. DBS9H8 TaxID=2937801 RepID=UPI00200CEE01|nr:BtrH N-terminal domain-containing protein [Conexibacter sp. DBS9H8]
MTISDRESRIGAAERLAGAWGPGRVGPADFAHARAGHCASGSLRDVLAFCGLDYGAGPLSEGMCFGLGSGLGFLYADVPGVRPPVYVVGRTEALEESFAANLGVGLEIEETDDPARGLARVVDELAAGRPPIVWADIAELEYLRVRMSNTRHAIVVVGVDPGEGVAWLADNDRDGLQPCSLASLARARDSQGFPGPNRHRTFLYRWPDRLGDPAVAVARAVNGAITNMRDGGSRLGGIDAPGGLAGVAAFAAAYRDWPARFGEHCGELLGALSIFIVKAGTGGAMFRSLYAEFLADAAALLDDRRLEETAEVAAALAGDWRALAATARAGEHGAGLAPLAAIVAGEHRLVEALEGWIGA